METETRIAVLENLMDAFDRRLKKVESHFSGDYQLVATKLTPHKCPVCEGCGIVFTEGAKADYDGMLKANLSTVKMCNSCEGKGVVWG